MRVMQCNWGLGPGGYVAGELLQSTAITANWLSGGTGVVADISRGAAYTFQAICDNVWPAFPGGTGYITLKAGTGFTNVNPNANPYRILDPANGVYGGDVRLDFKYDLPANYTVTSRTFASVTTSAGAAAGTLRLGSVNLGAGTYKITLVGFGAQELDYALAGSAWYRLEMHFECDPAGEGSASLNIYTIDTNTLLQTGSMRMTGIGAAGSLTQIRIGAIGGIDRQGPYTMSFANIAANNDQPPTSGSGINIGPCGAGKAAALVGPTSDSSVAWSSTGGSNYTEIDEADHTALSDADYVSSTTASLMQDKYGKAAYGGANDPRSVVLYFRHKRNATYGFPGTDAYHRGGLHDGTNAIVPSQGWSGTEGYTYYALIIDEQYGGGALTSSWYDACTIFIERYQNLSGWNAKDVSLVALEYEDDLGLSAPTVPGVQRASSQVL